MALTDQNASNGVIEVEFNGVLAKQESTFPILTTNFFVRLCVVILLTYASVQLAALEFPVGYRRRCRPRSATYLKLTVGLKGTRHRIVKSRYIRYNVCECPLRTSRTATAKQ
jgi:hypothetical protein